MKRLQVLIIFLFSANLFLFSQEKRHDNAFHTTLKNQVDKILIKGKSNINTWESHVENVDAKLILHSSQKLFSFHNLQETSTLIDTLLIKIKVINIKSGKKKMDQLTYNALKSDIHPYITFSYQLNTHTNLNSQEISGNLTIAGITKKITTQIIFNKEPYSLTLKGVHSIDMTEFGVKPPSLFFGLFRTKKKIDVDFILSFASNL